MHILLLFDYLQRYKTVMGFAMPSQQTEQIVQAALAAPINNLVVFGLLLSMVIVLGVGVLLWKFMPVILRQIQQLIDNNTQLTKIAETNSEQARVAQQSVDKNANELVKQTGLLTETNVLLTDFKNYQKLNNDQVADNTKQLENLTTNVGKIPESITSLKADIIQRFDELEAQIAEMLKDRPDCMGLKLEMKEFRAEMKSLLQPAVNAVAPASNVIDATDAGAKPASESGVAA